MLYAYMFSYIGIWIGTGSLNTLNLSGFNIALTRNIVSRNIPANMAPTASCASSGIAVETGVVVETGIAVETSLALVMASL